MFTIQRITRGLLAALICVGVAACSEDNPYAGYDEDRYTEDVLAKKGFDNASSAAAHTYQVTIYNLTPGQPFSPAAVATHTNKTGLFEVGAPASEGIRFIAENGNPATAVMELEDNMEVYSGFSTGAPVPPGGSLSFEIEARANAGYFSLAAMLVCTNDGFVGLNAIKLPGGKKEQTFDAFGYDAGTEENLETSETAADGCGLGDDGNLRAITTGTVAPHPGIAGIGDYDVMVHGWDEPAARVVVRRVK